MRQPPIAPDPLRAQQDNGTDTLLMVLISLALVASALVWLVGQVAALAFGVTTRSSWDCRTCPACSSNWPSTPVILGWRIRGRRGRRFLDPLACTWLWSSPWRCRPPSWGCW